MNATDIARHALIEIGRADIAAHLFANRIGDPMIGSLKYWLNSDADLRVAHKACLIAHQALGNVGFNEDVEQFLRAPAPKQAPPTRDMVQ